MSLNGMGSCSARTTISSDLDPIQREDTQRHSNDHESAAREHAVSNKKYLEQRKDNSILRPGPHAARE